MRALCRCGLKGSVFFVLLISTRGGGALWSLWAADGLWVGAWATRRVVHPAIHRRAPKALSQGARASGPVHKSIGRAGAYSGPVAALAGVRWGSPAGSSLLALRGVRKSPQGRGASAIDALARPELTPTVGSSLWREMAILPSQPMAFAAAPHE